VLVRKDDSVAGGMSEYSMSKQHDVSKGKEEKEDGKVVLGHGLCQVPKTVRKAHREAKELHLRRSGDGVRSVHVTIDVCTEEEKGGEGASGREAECTRYPSCIKEGITFPAEEVEYIY
jgi:hypothetical protein